MTLLEFDNLCPVKLETVVCVMSTHFPKGLFYGLLYPINGIELKLKGEIDSDGVWHWDGKGNAKDCWNGPAYQVKAYYIEFNDE